MLPHSVFRLTSASLQVPRRKQLQSTRALRLQLPRHDPRLAREVRIAETALLLRPARAVLRAQGLRQLRRYSERADVGAPPAQRRLRHRRRSWRSDVAVRLGAPAAEAGALPPPLAAGSQDAVRDVVAGRIRPGIRVGGRRRLDADGHVQGGDGGHAAPRRNRRLARRLRAHATAAPAVRPPLAAFHLRTPRPEEWVSCRSRCAVALQAVSPFEVCASAGKWVRANFSIVGEAAT
eukprot:SAG11_NODE_10490_length_828_cov_0.831276_1_plen_234_part_01